MKTFFSRQFFVFLITGGIAALVNFFSRIVYSLFMGFPSAVVMAFLTAMVAGYLLFRFFVFKESATSPARSAIYFTLVAVASLGQTMAVSLLMAYQFLPWLETWAGTWTGTWAGTGTMLDPSLALATLREEIAHFCGIMVPAFTSFLLHKHLTFRTAPST